MMSTWVKVL